MHEWAHCKYIEGYVCKNSLHYCQFVYKIVYTQWTNYPVLQWKVHVSIVEHLHNLA